MIVGVNEFAIPEKLQVPLLHVDEAGARHQLARLERVRRERDASRVQSTLNAVREAASKPRENLMPHLIDAVNAYATLGEIMGVLRQVWGEYREEAIV